MPVDDTILSLVALNLEMYVQYILAHSGISGQMTCPGFILAHGSLPGRCWAAQGRMMALSLLVTLDKLRNQDPQCPRLVERAQ